MKETEIMSWLMRAADHGITGIKVYYEGSGDSGAIDYIHYTTDPLGEDEDAAFDYIDSMEGWSSEGLNLNSLDSELYTAIDNFAVEHILEDIEDWWNNDGGYGSLCIIVPSGKYKIFNNIRVTDYESFYHEGSLIEKSAE